MQLTNVDLPRTTPQTRTAVEVCKKPPMRNGATTSRRSNADMSALQRIHAGPWQPTCQPPASSCPACPSWPVSA